MKKLIKKILKEDNDFGWADDIQPISKNDIANELSELREWGYYIHDQEKHPDGLVDFIYSLGLDGNKLDGMVGVLYDFGESVYDSGRGDGIQVGWEEGNNEGYREGKYDGERDAKADINDDIEEARVDGYDEGYDEGYDKAYNEFKDRLEDYKEKIYNKGFEEGRAYESEKEVEEYERGESGFDPKDYDEEYEN